MKPTQLRNPKRNPPVRVVAARKLPPLPWKMSQPKLPQQKSKLLQLSSARLQLEFKKAVSVLMPLFSCFGLGSMTYDV
jgi:hypothetical protein